MHRLLLLVPTGPLQKDNKLSSGSLRLDRAAHILRRDASDHIAIIGGVRRFGKSQAQEHYDHFVHAYPDLKNRVAFIDASSTCTSRDVQNALGKIDQFYGIKDQAMRKHCTLGIVSYKEHCQRIQIMLQRAGFKHITCFLTDEKVHYPAWVEKLLQWVTEIDPFWRWFGLPFVWMTSTR